MMVSFNNKKINAIKTLGERLQEHRLSMGLSLEEISHQTQININYLIALESDEFEKLPADVYTKNFLQKYAESLDLNPETVYDIFEQEKIIYFKTKKQKAKTVKKESLPKRIFIFFLKPQFIKYSISIIIVGILLFYIGWGINQIFTPPKLVITEPRNSLITSNRQILIKGETEKEVLLTINGQEITSDQYGNFKNQIDLQKGLNIIKITAEKEHSKENVKYLQIIVEDGSNYSKYK